MCTCADRRGATVMQICTAAFVSRPAIPSTPSPRASWNFSTAVLVAAPNLPSTARPASMDRFSSCWSQITALPVAPCFSGSRPVSYHSVSLR